MAKDILFEVEGIEEVENLFKNLSPRLEENLYTGFEKYVRRHLVTRIKTRLANATQPLSPGNYNPETGTASGSGGYEVPKNSDKYAEWKSSRSNLPIVGNLSPRELVATGHLVESIDVTYAAKASGMFEFAVGAKPGERPVATPFTNNPKGSFQADVSKRIDNAKLVEFIEDSKYAFLAKEYEDVVRDIEPLVLYILKETLYELAKEFGGKK